MSVLNKYTKRSLDTKLDIFNSYESGLLTESEKYMYLNFFEAEDDTEDKAELELKKKRIKKAILLSIAAVAILIVASKKARKSIDYKKHDRNITTLEGYSEKLKDLNKALTDANTTEEVNKILKDMTNITDNFCRIMNNDSTLKHKMTDDQFKRWDKIVNEILSNLSI